MIVGERVLVKMTVMVTGIVIILLVLMVVKADDHVQYSSPHPHSKILASLASNSSEDLFDPKRIIHKIIHNVEKRVVGASQKNIVGLSKGSPSEISTEKRGSKSTNIPNYENKNSMMSNDSNHVSVTYGFNLIKSNEKSEPMRDYVVASTCKIGEHEVLLFAIFDGYLSNRISAYLRNHLFDTILAQPTFLSDTTHAVRQGYFITATRILEDPKLDGYGGLAGSTAVTAILIKLHGQSNYNLVVANVGTSRAIICSKNGVAEQLSVDHVIKNEMERQPIIEKGSEVPREPGGGNLYSGEIWPTKGFGFKSLKQYISCEPHMVMRMIDDEIEFMVLVSYPVLHNMMSNQELVDSIRHIEDPRDAAQHLNLQAIARGVQRFHDLTADLSSLVVRFR